MIKTASGTKKISKTVAVGLSTSKLAVLVECWKIGKVVAHPRIFDVRVRHPTILAVSLCYLYWMKPASVFIRDATRLLDLASQVVDFDTDVGTEKLESGYSGQCHEGCGNCVLG